MESFLFFFCLDKAFNNQFQQLQGIELMTQSSDLRARAEWMSPKVGGGNNTAFARFLMRNMTPAQSTCSH